MRETSLALSAAIAFQEPISAMESKTVMTEVMSWDVVSEPV